MRRELLLIICSFSVTNAFVNVPSFQSSRSRITPFKADGSAVNGSSANTVTKPTKKIKKKRYTKKKVFNNDQQKKKQSGRKKASERSKILSSSSEQELLPITDLKLGSRIDGYVASFTPFGMFVKTAYDFKDKGSNGYALLHKSQIGDEKVEDLTKLFRIGAKVKNLRVININYAKGEVGVSLRQKRPDRIKLSEVPVGVEIEGTVANVLAYGAFIDVGADANALLHISRISQKKIRNIRAVISEGEKVTVRILSKDLKKKTMAASMLDKDADEYLDMRSKQMKQMKESTNMELESLKTEIEYFEEAVRELEQTLGK